MIGYNAYNKIMRQVNNRNRRGMLKISIISDGIDGIDYMATDGSYFVSYSPENKYGEQRSKKVLINLDLGRKLRANNWEDFIRMSKEDELAKFILEYTNINEELVEMAINNPKIRIPFCLDVIKVKKATIEKLRKEKKPIDEYGMMSTLLYPPRKKKLK